MSQRARSARDDRSKWKGVRPFMKDMPQKSLCTWRRGVTTFSGVAVRRSRRRWRASIESQPARRPAQPRLRLSPVPKEGTAGAEGHREDPEKVQHSKPGPPDRDRDTPPRP